jgi:transcriptional regulator with XRE-family HTH domain
MSPEQIADHDDDTYWVEMAKTQFALSLEQHRRALGLNYKAVADRYKRSPAYITKVFRGDENLTIASMVKLARALGGHLDLKVGNAKPVLAAPTAEGGVEFPSFDDSPPPDHFNFEPAEDIDLAGSEIELQEFDLPVDTFTIEVKDESRPPIQWFIGNVRREFIHTGASEVTSDAAANSNEYKPVSLAALFA